MHDLDIRNGLLPVGLFSISKGKVTRGIDLSVPAKIRIDDTHTEFVRPNKSNSLLGTGAFTQERLTDKAIELMLGSGNSTDELTRLVWREYRLPNWVRMVSIIKFEMDETTAIEVRPVSSEERVALSVAISELRNVAAHSDKTAQKIRQLVSRFNQFKVGCEADLSPFVIPIYPVRVEGQKALSYRVFAVSVGWDPSRKIWRRNTAFEVITTTNSAGNNFVVNADMKIDEDGLVSHEVTCENRWVKASGRAAQLMK